MRHCTKILKATIAIFLVVLTFTSAAGSVRAAVDIGPMTWTPRSDWLNVKTCSAITGGSNAVGDGVTDDTAAIQAALTYIQTHLTYAWLPNSAPVTVYFPPGTYKISSTLAMGSTLGDTMYGVSLIGCGSSTIIKWADTAPIGPAMFAPDGTDQMHYIGLAWDGNNRAGCGIELNTTGKFDGSSPNTKGVPIYETDIRIENSSFKNFTQLGSYAPLDPKEPLYGAGIAQGFENTGNPTSEVMIYNCSFSNCTFGASTTLQFGPQNYMWNVDGCEFDNCGVGLSYWSAACYIVTNCHFQHSGTDIEGGSTSRIRHCTSRGSGAFYWELDGPGSLNPDVIQDCWVDGWTTSGPAIRFGNLGSNTVFDCTFTHPPSGAKGAIHNNAWGPPATSYLLSANSAPDFPGGLGIMDPGTPLRADLIPTGQRGGMVSSAGQTFLKTTWSADSTHIIDVTQAPYTADRTGNADATATIQAAINAAKTANNGSIVYFPVGTYKITATLTASGGNYTLQGTSIRTGLSWAGAANGSMLTISNPQNITVQGLTLDNASGPAVFETATGPSSITYDEIFCPLYYDDNVHHVTLPPGQGLVLSNLPAHSTVFLKHVKVPFKVINSGAARILAKYLEFGAINVSGTARQTGFLGVMEGESAQPVAGVYNITINDNQDFVMDDYYTEQQDGDLDLERGNGTGTGRVTIQGIASATGHPITSILVNNYAGRLFYGSQSFGNNNNPIQITANGTNPLDLILAGDDFFGDLQPFNFGSGINLIEAMDTQQTTSKILRIDTPNPLPSPALASIAAGLDHLRQLETASAAQQAGLVGYWKLDESTGSTSYDSTVSGLDGTRINSPAFSATQPSAIGFFDPGSLAFNGVNQYVNIPVTTALPSGISARTICGWAKSNTLAGGYRLIAAYGSPNTSQAMFIGMNGTALVGGGYSDDLTIPNFWDSNWHFIALTYDGVTANLYADGMLKASTAKNWNLLSSKCYIGEQINNQSEYWNGLIDDVRIYNRALSTADIFSLAGAPYCGTPYGGTYWPIPGQIEAENYDLGGQNIGYYDTTTGNSGGAYRNDDVDVFSTSDTGGGYAVGWTAPGEWLDYTVNVATAGNYDFQVREANASGVTGAVHIEVDGTNVTGAIPLPMTADWNTYTTVTKTSVALTAGPHLMRLYFDAGYSDINYINIVHSYAGTPYGGTAWPIPGKIEAENYDLGGQNGAYYDTSPGNTGGAYRSDDVDIAGTSDTGGGYAVGWTAPGEWLNYTVNVATAGNYAFQVREANGSTNSPNAHIEIDGANVTGAMSLPPTGGWDTYTTVTKASVPLTAGPHILRLYLDDGNTCINYMNLAAHS